MEDVRFNLVSEAWQIQVERITSTKLCRWRRVRRVPVTCGCPYQMDLCWVRWELRLRVKIGAEIQSVFYKIG